MDSCTATNTDSLRALALYGGTPVRTRPFAPWPYFAEDEIATVAGILRSGRVNYWTGTEGREFESEFAASVGRHHAVAVANGTVALELALYALDIGVGDDVIVPSRTFIASASCAVMRGATPVMADVDRHSQNLTAETIKKALSPRSKAIIAVHLAGWPCDMDPIMALARERNLYVIEDCAQAHGATYKGSPVGSFGDVAAFSFCQDKMITTGGEGGMLVTDNSSLWSRAWGFKDHGKSYDAIYHRAHPSGFRWVHESFGTNWRMTDMQSALGRVLIKKLPLGVERRRRNATVLLERLSLLPQLRIPIPGADFVHCYYKFYAFVRPDTLAPGWNRDRIMEALAAEGIPCMSGSCSEIYLERAFPLEWQPAPRLAVARELGETSLMFLVHPTLGEQDMLDTCAAVEKVLRAAAL
jgi:dTDP-4-amino-4,6-dideoxygalactose transaminase